MRQQEHQARVSGSGSPFPAHTLEDSPSTADPSTSPVNPFLDDDIDTLGGLGDLSMAAGNGGGPYRNGSSTGGGSSGSPMWGASKPPLQQQQRWKDAVWSSEGGGAGSMGLGSTSGGGSSFAGRDEQFGSLHETGQVRCAVALAVHRCLAQLQRHSTDNTYMLHRQLHQVCLCTFKTEGPLVVFLT